MNAQRRLHWASSALACLLACSGAPAEHSEKQPAESTAAASPHDDGHEHAALPTRVRLTPEVIAAAKIRTAPITREALSSTLALPGEIVADPDRSAKVASPAAGHIERIAFREGSAVTKGATLAIIRVPDLGKHRSALATSQARAKAARLNASRLEQLVQQRLASEQAHHDAVAEADAFEAEVRAASEQLAALGLGASASDAPSQLTLRAPISGVVVSRNAVVGQPVTAAEVIAEIVELSQVWFLGRVFEKDLGKLALGASAEVQLNAYPKERFAGVIEYLGRQVDLVARTVTARVRLDNRNDQLRVGLFGTAYVSSADERAKQAVLVVPRTALTEVAGKTVVFVRQGDRDFEQHEVVLGESAGGKVQILAGLRDGEQVVVEGAFTIKSAVLKSTLAEDE